MEKLSREQVMHVAELAKLSVSEGEVEKYAVQLAAILTEIDKINNVNISNEEDLLIAPISHDNRFSKDVVKGMSSKEEIFKNAKNYNDDYIIVPKVIE